MSKKYDIVAITGTYQKDGQDKTQFENVGAIFEKEGKFYLKMNKIVFHDDGHVVNFFNLYAPQPRGQKSSGNTPPAADQQAPDFDDDIPF